MRITVSNSGMTISRPEQYIEHPVPRYNAYARSVYEQSYSEQSSLEVFREIFEVKGAAL